MLPFHAKRQKLLNLRVRYLFEIAYFSDMSLGFLELAHKEICMCLEIFAIQFMSKNLGFVE